MPEIKHTFQAGKMNKDLDERLVPNGQYRDAMNIQVRTTDGSDSGAVQNIQGNTLLNAASGLGDISILDTHLSDYNQKVIASVADEKSDKAYFFVSTPKIENLELNYFTAISYVDESINSNFPIFLTDSILEVDCSNVTSNPVVRPVVIDKFGIIGDYGNIINGSPNNITGDFASGLNNTNAGGPQTQTWTQLEVNDGSLYKEGMRMIAIEIVTVNTLDENGNIIGLDTANSYTNIVTPNARIKSIDDNTLTFYTEQTPYEYSDNGFNNVDLIIFYDEGVLKFNTDTKITGINIIDDLLFWTDNKTEPKKINITRCKEGTPNFTTHTKLKVSDPTNINNELTSVSELELSSINDDLKEEHITVIRKAPKTAPTLHMESRTEEDTITNISGFTFGNVNNDDTITITDNGLLDSNFRSNDILMFEGTVVDNINALVNDEVIEVQASFISYQNENDEDTLSVTNTIKINIIILGDSATSSTYDWTIKTQLPKPLFELKFCRFGYRYKYEDGEYSSFSPWSELAFKPNEFDYSAKKGYNLGMVNTVTELVVKDFIPHVDERSNDVIAVELLYKTTDSPNVYTLKTITREKDPEWELFTPSDDLSSPIKTGELTITSEMIHRVLPSNQLLRSWDNVPRYALAQEITANRLIYGNYTQGYNVKFPVGLNQFITSNNSATIDSPQKSIKSIRNYKFGMVFGDKYGRETPVVTSGYTTGDNNDYKSLTGDIIVEKAFAKMSNSFTLTQNWTNPMSPQGGEPELWMDYVKYYIKETSNEYYNLVMDRWYYAEKDQNLWLSFPSADRNKVDEETYIILKNEHGSDTPVEEKARYKIISIESEAPDYIKIKHKLMGGVELDLTASSSTQAYDEGALSGGGFFEGTVDANLFPPSNLMNATEIPIPVGNWNYFLHNYKDEGKLLFQIVGQTINQNTNIVQNTISSGKWISVSHYKMDNEGNAAIFFDKSQGNEFDMFTKFTNAGYTLNSTTHNLRYFIKFKEELVEDENPEFDGRFFVLIEKDAIIEDKIQKLTSDSSSWVESQNYEVAYIDTQMPHPSNPGDSGYGGIPWGYDNADTPVHDWSGFDGLSTNFDDYGNPVTIGGLNNIEFFALGCHGPWKEDAMPEAIYTLDNHDAYIASQDKYIRNYASATQMFWVAWKQHMGCDDCDDTTKTKLFIDSAMSQKNWVNSTSGAGDGEYNTWGDGVSAWNYKPTGLDQGGAANGTLGRVIFSTLSKVGWTGNALRAEFKSRMMAQGTVFKFKNDPNPNNFYKVLAGALENDGYVHNYGTVRMKNTGYSSGNQTNNQYPPNWPAFIGGHSSNPWWLNPIYNPDETNVFGESIWWFANSNANIQTIASLGVEALVGPDIAELPGIGPHTVVNHPDLTQENIWAGSIYYYQQPPDTMGGNAWGKLWQGYFYTDLFFNLASWPDITQDITTLSPFYYQEHCGECELSEDVGGLLSWMGNEESCRRSSFRIEFRKIDLETGQFIGNADQGINIDEWDPRSVVRHDGYTGVDNDITLGIVVMQKVTSAGSIIIPDEDSAIWETEPKKDADLDLYYEASPSIPMTLKKGSTLSFAPINCKVDINRNINSVVSSVNLNNSNIKFTNVEYVESSEEPIFYIESTNNTTGATSAHVTNMAIGDTMIFNHNDGLKTRSTRTDYYQQIDTYYSPQTRYTRTIRHNSNAANPNQVTIDSISDMSFSPSLNIVGGDDCIQSECSDGVINGIFTTNTPSSVSTLELSDTSWMDQSGATASDNTEYTVEFIAPTGWYKLDPEAWKYPVNLSWFNCYSYGNGLETDRIRDDFNAPQIDNGIKVSTTLDEYGEEIRGSGLIHSGLYNSTSGVNDLNEFNMSEKIAKDLNPAYGSIQALKTRENNVVVLAEDKILKVLANKDAVYNADGNPQLIATNRTLGDVTPFAGDYGISKNPESLAWDQYRLYFTDKQRGAVLRLSMDGLTPISNVGMKTWFRDNLKKTSNLLGTFDKINGEYNLTFNYNDAFSYGSEYYTDKTISFNEASKGWISFKSFIPQTGLSVSDEYLTATGFNVYKHYGDGSRNTFYGAYTESSVKLLFNDIPGSVKSFNTINYEGSQAQIGQLTNISALDAAGNSWDDNDVEYYNLTEKFGWYVSTFETDLQSGRIGEFKDKEGKWFNYITGLSTTFGNIDTSEFSVQGIGGATSVATSRTSYYSFYGGNGDFTASNLNNFFTPGSGFSSGEWSSGGSNILNNNIFWGIGDPYLSSGVPTREYGMCESVWNSSASTVWYDGQALEGAAKKLAFQIYSLDVAAGTKVYFDFAASGTGFTIDDFTFEDTENITITSQSDTGFTGTATAELVTGGYANGNINGVDVAGALMCRATWSPLTMVINDGVEGLETFTVTLQQYDSAGNCLYDCGSQPQVYNNVNEGILQFYGLEDQGQATDFNIRKIIIKVQECEDDPTTPDFSDPAYQLTLKNDPNYLTDED